MLAKINQFFKGIKTLKFLAQVCRTYFVFKPDRCENPFCLYCKKITTSLLLTMKDFRIAIVNKKIAANGGNKL